MLRLLIRISLITLFMLPALLYAQQNDKPNVLILTTGGTIASRADAPLKVFPSFLAPQPEKSPFYAKYLTLPALSSF